MSDLFNNPMVKSAMESMTEEQKREYEQMGKYLFSTDFEKTQEKYITPEEELSYILQRAVSSLKSGLDPKDLSKKEIQVLYEIKGEKWYEEFGFEKSEVPEPMIPLIQSGSALQQQAMKKRSGKKEKAELARQLAIKKFGKKE